ncbi:MAG: SprB repeat-containing protein, partial [Bacteroidota bacterium]
MNPTRHIVMRSFGCKFISVLFSFLFFAGLASAQLSVSISGVSPTCNGWTNGSVTATATGGIAPYTYNWSNGVVGAVNGGLGAGTYSVTATDANNQTATAIFTLTQPAALTVNVVLANVCSGNGNATASVSGGVAPYSYAWSNGASGASVTGLPAGFQCVTVTDANGCQAIGCTNVAAALSISMVVKGIACFNFCDASVEAVVTGGTGPYTYSWSNGATGSVNENLGPGTYSVTVTDANGC